MSPLEELCKVKKFCHNIWVIKSNWLVKQQTCHRSIGERKQRPGNNLMRNNIITLAQRLIKQNAFNITKHGINYEQV